MHDDGKPSDMHAIEALPSWPSLQKVSFYSWVSSLCRDVLRRTPFSAFLRSTMTVRRSQLQGSEKALCPFPVPRDGIFSSHKKVGSRRRRKIAFDRGFHVVIMALNFWHADCNFVPSQELAKIPSPAQTRCLVNMRKLLKAYGSCEDEVSVPSSGRRSTTLTSQLADLCEFLTWQGASGDSYR